MSNNTKMICAANGKVCEHKPDKRGVYPCKNCSIGIEFIEKFGTFLFHDEV